MASITLTDTYADLDNSAATGKVRLAPWQALVSAEMNQTITIQPITKPLVNGAFAVSMPVLPDVVKVFVEVQVLLEFCRPDVFVVDVPLDGTDPVILSDLPRVEYAPPEPDGGPVVLWQEVGATVAPLVNGFIPNQFLPPGEGSVMWFIGSGPPPDPLAGSKAGDLYVDSGTGVVYRQG